MPAWSTSLFAFGDNVQVSGARACLPRAPRQRAHAPPVFDTWPRRLLLRPQMTLCAMTGVGVCVIHGHVQDALYGNGYPPSLPPPAPALRQCAALIALTLGPTQTRSCCLSCMIAFFTLGEFGRQVACARVRVCACARVRVCERARACARVCEQSERAAFGNPSLLAVCAHSGLIVAPCPSGRCVLFPPPHSVSLSSGSRPQRSFFRKRLEMPGGEYVCPGVFGDFFEVLFCFPLTACQEARELEIRSMRRWRPLTGFRGKGPCLEECIFLGWSAAFCTQACLCAVPRPARRRGRSPGRRRC